MVNVGGIVASCRGNVCVSRSGAEVATLDGLATYDSKWSCKDNIGHVTCDSSTGVEGMSGTTIVVSSWTVLLFVGAVIVTSVAFGFVVVSLSSGSV